MRAQHAVKCSDNDPPTPISCAVGIADDLSEYDFDGEAVTAATYDEGDQAEFDNTITALAGAAVAPEHPQEKTMLKKLKTVDDYNTFKKELLRHEHKVRAQEDKTKLQWFTNDNILWTHNVTGRVATGDPCESFPEDRRLREVHLNRVLKAAAIVVERDNGPTASAADGAGAKTGWLARLRGKRAAKPKPNLKKK